MEDYMEAFVKATDFHQNKPIREIVYDSLRNTIISGIIPVGERIIEKEYAERLNISRTPVREALRRLEEEELVEYIPRVGVVVKRISMEDVIEIYTIRHHLDILATNSAIDNITDKEIEEIGNLLNLTEQKNKEGNVEEVIKLFGQFNSKIYEASKMKRLTSMIINLNEYLRKFRTITISDDKRRQNAIEDHKRIFKAICEKNKEAIPGIIEKHLHDSVEVVYTEIKD